MAVPEKMHARGELRRDEPMSRHTSWRAGGNADLFFIPASVEDLQAFLRELDEETPIFWLGVGSNLLVRDGGLRGVVISATSILKKLERIDSYLVRAGSGVARSLRGSAFAGASGRPSFLPVSPARSAVR